MTSIYDVCFYGGLILCGIFLITAVVLFFALNIPKVVGDLTGSTARRKIREMKAHAESITLDKSVTRKEQAKYYNVGTGKITVKESNVPVQTKSKSRKKAAQMPDQAANPEKKQDGSVKIVPRQSAPEQRMPQEQREASRPAQPLEDITEVLGAGRLAGSEAKTDVLSAEEAGFNDYDDYGDHGAPVGDNSETEVLSAYSGDSVTEVLSGSYSDGDEAATEVLSGSHSDGDEAATEVLAFDNSGAEAYVPKFKTEEKTDNTGRSKNRPGFTVLMDVMLIHTQDTI